MEEFMVALESDLKLMIDLLLALNLNTSMFFSVCGFLM